MHLRNTLGLLVISVLLLGGCSGSHGSPGSSIPLTPGASSSSVAPVLLTHAALAEMAHVQLENSSAAHFTAPAMPHDPAPLLSQGHHALSSTVAGDFEVAGTFINSGGPYTGVFLQQTAYPAANFPLSYPTGAKGYEELLAPLTSPPGGSCVSASTGAVNAGSGTGTYFVVFNNCQAAPNSLAGLVVAQPIDSAFMSKYVILNQNNGVTVPQYFMEIGTPDIHPSATSTWYVLLHNNVTASWDIVYQTTGISTTTYGYSVYYQLYQAGQCPGGGLPPVAADTILLYNPSGGLPTFNLANSTFSGNTTQTLNPGTLVGNANCFTADSTGPATNFFTMTRPNTDWNVTNGKSLRYNVSVNVMRNPVSPSASPPPPNNFSYGKTVTVVTGATFNGQPNLIDAHTVFDPNFNSPPGSSHVNDSFSAYVANGSVVNVNGIGFTDQNIQGSFSSHDVLKSTGTDLLYAIPQVAGATWQRNESLVDNYSESGVGYQYSNKTTQPNDGSYQFDDSGSDTSSTYNDAFTDHQTVNPDATAAFSSGYANSNNYNALQSWTVAVPQMMSSVSVIPVSETCQTGTATPTVAPIGTPSPQPNACFNPLTKTSSPSFNVTANIPNFYPATFIPLLSDTASIPSINTPVPSQCNVSPLYGTAAWQLHRSYFDIDPANGLLVTFTNDSYFLPNVGLACMVSVTSVRGYDVGGLTGNPLFNNTRTVVTSLQPPQTFGGMSTATKRAMSVTSGTYSVLDQAADATISESANNEARAFFAQSRIQVQRMERAILHPGNTR